MSADPIRRWKPSRAQWMVIAAVYGVALIAYGDYMTPPVVTIFAVIAGALLFLWFESRR